MSAALTFALVSAVFVFQSSTTSEQNIVGNTTRRNMEAFLKAAMIGDTSVMLELMEGGFGINVDSQDEDGETALMVAAINGQTKAVRWLLDNQHAHVEIKDSNGQTALVHAVRYNRFPTVSILLNRGARADTQDNWGNTPLMYAVNNGKAGIVEMLLDQGADIAATANGGQWAGQNPLALALRQNKADLVRRLSRSNIATKYFKLKEGNVTWEDSVIHCAERNARLGQIKSAAERDAITILSADATATSGCSGYWLGGRSAGYKKKEAYEWIGDRSPVVITNWASNQPDRNGCSYDATPGTNDYCIRILQTGEWDDIACTHSNEMDGAICEYF